MQPDICHFFLLFTQQLFTLWTVFFYLLRLNSRKLFIPSFQLYCEPKNKKSCRIIFSHSFLSWTLHFLCLTFRYKFLIICSLTTVVKLNWFDGFITLIQKPNSFTNTFDCMDNSSEIKTWNQNKAFCMLRYNRNYFEIRWNFN